MSKVLDSETIETLRTYKDKDGKSLLQTLAEIFINTVPSEIKELQSRFEKRDLLFVEKTAHSLKSTAGGLGALKLSENLANIEDHLASLEGQPPNEALLIEWLKVIGQELDPVITELKKLL